MLYRKPLLGMFRKSKYSSEQDFELVKSQLKIHKKIKSESEEEKRQERRWRGVTPLVLLLPSSLSWQGLGMGARGFCFSLALPSSSMVISKRLSFQTF